jgi:hypothetical protein
MPDANAQADLRGIDIQKLAVGFSEEDILFKKFCTVTPTAAREIRWYQKTSGFLDSSDTTAITASQIANVDFKSRPVVVEQSWTRQTSYVRKYFVESPLISDEDIRDCDPDILATNLHDLTRAVNYQVDARIWDVMTVSRQVTGATINVVDIGVSGTWTGELVGASTNPVKNILSAKQKIRAYGYNPENGVLFLNSHDHGALLNWLISTKGSSIPSYSSERVGDGVVMNILGLRVVVSENVTANFACVYSNEAVRWKEFVPTTARTVEEVGIGTKIRVWEEGEGLLEQPRGVCILSGTGIVAL